MNKKTITGLTFTIIILLAIVFTFQFINTKNADISISLSSTAESMLASLGVPSNSNNVSDIEVTDADGTMPEMALRSFTIDSNPRVLKQYYVKQCQQAALSQPSAENLQIEPNIICEGQTQAGTLKVYLYPQCENSSCKVNIETRFWNI